ncbi:hypothetical protein HDZ31DRAFT_74110 [Schizophyllum fasciatum]
MAATLNPWIAKYLLKVSQEHGSQISRVPPSRKKVQIIRFRTTPGDEEDAFVWAEVSDKEHHIPIRFSKEAVANNRQRARARKLDGQTVIALVTIKPTLARVPHGAGKQGVSEEMRNTFQDSKPNNEEIISEEQGQKASPLVVYNMDKEAAGPSQQTQHDTQTQGTQALLNDLYAPLSAWDLAAIEQFHASRSKTDGFAHVDGDADDLAQRSAKRKRIANPLQISSEPGSPVSSDEPISGWEPTPEPDAMKRSVLDAPDNGDADSASDVGESPQKATSAGNASLTKRFPPNQLAKRHFSGASQDSSAKAPTQDPSERRSITSDYAWQTPLKSQLSKASRTPGVSLFSPMGALGDSPAVPMVQAGAPPAAAQQTSAAAGPSSLGKEVREQGPVSCPELPAPLVQDSAPASTTGASLKATAPVTEAPLERADASPHSSLPSRAKTMSAQLQRHVPPPAPPPAMGLKDGSAPRVLVPDSDVSYSNSQSQSQPSQGQKPSQDQAMPPPPSQPRSEPPSQASQSLSQPQCEIAQLPRPPLHPSSQPPQPSPPPPPSQTSDRGSPPSPGPSQPLVHSSQPLVQPSQTHDQSSRTRPQSPAQQPFYRPSSSKHPAEARTNSLCAPSLSLRPTSQSLRPTTQPLRARSQSSQPGPSISRGLNARPRSVARPGKAVPLVGFDVIEISDDSADEGDGEAASDSEERSHGERPDGQTAKEGKGSLPAHEDAAVDDEMAGDLELLSAAADESIDEDNSEADYDAEDEYDWDAVFSDGELAINLERCKTPGSSQRVAEWSQRKKPNSRRGVGSSQRTQSSVLGEAVAPPLHRPDSPRSVERAQRNPPKPNSKSINSLNGASMNPKGPLQQTQMGATTDGRSAEYKVQVPVDKEQRPAKPRVSIERSLHLALLKATKEASDMDEDDKQTNKKLFGKPKDASRDRFPQPDFGHKPQAGPSKAPRAALSEHAEDVSSPIATQRVPHDAEAWREPSFQRPRPAPAGVDKGKRRAEPGPRSTSSQPPKKRARKEDHAGTEIVPGNSKRDSRGGEGGAPWASLAIDFDLIDLDVDGGKYAKSCVTWEGVQEILLDVGRRRRAKREAAEGQGKEAGRRASG